MSFYIILHEKASNINDLQKKVVKRLADFGLKGFTAEIEEIELQENQAVATRVACAQTKLLEQAEKAEQSTQKQADKKLQSYRMKIKT